MTLSLDNVSKANSLESSVDAFVSEVARVYTEAGNNPVKIKDVTNELQGRREDIKKAFKTNLSSESPDSDLQKEVDRLKQENEQLKQAKPAAQATTRAVNSLVNSGGRPAFGIPSGRISETVPGQPLAADPYGKHPNEERVRINQDTGEVEREMNDQNQFSSLPSDQGAEMIVSVHKSVMTADGQQTMAPTPGVNAMHDSTEANEKLQENQKARERLRPADAQTFETSQEQNRHQA